MKFIRNCKCVDIEPQSKECYSNMITVTIPEHMHEYMQHRVQGGFTDKICIDPCIFREINYLWSKGIITYGSCCGHKKHESYVDVDDSSIDKMIEMGYKQNHPDKNRLDSFRLKSA